MKKQAKNTEKRSVGRPKTSDLAYVGFKADPETVAAIETLIGALQLQPGMTTRSKKSMAIRVALIEAANRVR